MKSLTSVFIGIVDILGYSKAEEHIDKYGSEASAAIIKKIYDSLDNYVYSFEKDEIHWIRYGDGYVFYSESDDIENLELMIKDASKLIALEAINYIPLRIAITQGDIKIDESKQDGLSITGSGWNSLQKLEKALDWMGGWLYLPNYDNRHHPTVTKLISTTHLIIEQNHSNNEQHKFIAPFKTSNYMKDKAWFFNWQKVLHQQDQDNDNLINNWWISHTHTSINENSEVQKKQKNTIAFAHYCNTLYQSATLVYFSKINSDLKIESIMSSV